MHSPIYIGKKTKYDDDESKDSKKTKIVGKSQLMLKLLQDYIFQIENKSYDPKFTDFMEKAIKWDNRVNTMAKVDTNASILAVWRHKFMAQKVLNTMETLINLFQNQHIELKNSQPIAEEVLWKNTDKFIEILMRIALYDIRKVREHLADIVQNNSIGASEFWEYLNSTWRNAFEYGSSWLCQLSSNPSINKLYARRQTPIHKWLSNNIEEFDYDEYQKQSQKLRDNDDWAFKMRQVSNALSGSTTYNSRRNYNNRNSNIRNNIKKPRKQSTAIQNMLKEIMPPFNKFMPNMEWPNTFCGFYHSSKGCKLGDKCKRVHKCPVCDSKDHKVDKCTGPTKNNK